MEYRIIAHTTPYQIGIGLYISQQDRLSNIVYAAEPILMKEVSPGMFHPPAMDISPESAQGLMDSLWTIGIRPSDGTASTGQLKATENHLKDMQRLVFGLMTKGLSYPGDLHGKD